MTQVVPPFTAGQLEAICRVLGEATTGSQLSRLLPDALVLTQVSAGGSYVGDMLFGLIV